MFWTARFERWIPETHTTSATSVIVGVAMGQEYRQLGLDERIEIYRLHRAGKSVRAIAVSMGRAPSTICRELHRNSRKTKVWDGGYEPARAHGLALRRRRWDCRHKLARQPALQQKVRDCLAMGWSPEQIAGRLAREQGGTVISHESIYRFIYHRSAQKDYWHRLLPRARHRRGRLGKRGGSPVDRIRDRVPVSQRPSEAGTRKQAGHWEADLMLFSRYGQAVLVTHERRSRFTRITRQPNKAARPVLDSLLGQFRHLPPAIRRSVTFDNGTEFALHHQLKSRLGIETFFCDPHAPWQKGGVENAICRLRRFLPRKSDLASITQEQLDELVAKYNNTPRKCLNFKTPAELFSEQVKHVALQV